MMNDILPEGSRPLILDVRQNGSRPLRIHRRTLDSPAVEHSTGGLQEILCGEIDALLTAVTEIGETVGVPTPNTDALLGMVRVFQEAHHG